MPGSKTLVLSPTQWPPLEDEERNDRGFVHRFFLTGLWTANTGDDYEILLTVPRRETWILRYINWLWAITAGGCPAPTFAGLEVNRRLSEFVEKTFPDVGPAVGGGGGAPTTQEWTPKNNVCDVPLTTTYPLTGGTTITGVVRGLDKLLFGPEA